MKTFMYLLFFAAIVVVVLVIVSIIIVVIRLRPGLSSTYSCNNSAFERNIVSVDESLQQDDETESLAYYNKNLYKVMLGDNNATMEISIAKFSAGTGNLLWRVAIFDVNYDYADINYASLVVDATGIYFSADLTTESMDMGSTTLVFVANELPFLAKFDLDGVFVWVKQLVAADAFDVFKDSMVVSDAVYIEGESLSSLLTFGTGEPNETTLLAPCLYLASFDKTTGELNWVMNYDFSNPATGAIMDQITQDDDFIYGNIFVGTANVLTLSGTIDITTVAFPAWAIARFSKLDGACSWATSVLEDFFGPNKITMCGSNLYVTTGFDAGPATVDFGAAGSVDLNSSYIVASLNKSTGDWRWVRQLISSNTMSINAINCCGSKVFISGQFVDDVTYDLATADEHYFSAPFGYNVQAFYAAYNADGLFLYHQSFSSPVPNASIPGGTVDFNTAALDSYCGNIYFAGLGILSADINGDLKLVKRHVC